MNPEPHIVYGDTPSIFDRLENPHIMGAVLQGAFCASTLRCAQRIAERETYNRPGRHSVPLAWALDAEENQAATAPLKSDFNRLKGLFSAVSDRLLRRCGVFDQSRVEPAYGDQFTRNSGPWHCDITGKLAGVAVPAGITSEYLAAPVPGLRAAQGVFVPDNPQHADGIALSLNNSDFAVIKVADFPYPPEIAEKGLVHRRPNAKLETLARTARIVFHFKTL